MPTAADFETALERHVIDVWFPRSVDSEFGGFLCDFDRAWRSCGPHCKLLEFQARHTMFAADAAALPKYADRTRRAAIHGFHCLRDMMWDNDTGGWFYRTDRQGHPLETSIKHTHGMAYAIQACAAVHESTGEPGALTLAQQGFDWIDAHAHDALDGGYFGLLDRNGTPVQSRDGRPWGMDADTIDVPIGCKDFNTNSDLLEAFTILYRIAPTPTLNERLMELIDIISTKLLSPSGALAFICRKDWLPISHLARFGTECQTVHRLLAAGPLLQLQDKTLDIARRVMNHVLHFGWDQRNGGVFYAGPASAPTRIEGYSLLVPMKSWWVQVEALRALLSLHALDPSAGYDQHAERIWKYIDRNYLDPRYGGIYTLGLDQQPRWQRQFRAMLAPAAATRKGGEWKDASHDGRAWLYCAALRASSTGA